METENKIVAFILPVHLQIMGMGGTHNGYVAIPKTHPYYEKHYDSIDDISVHGGLTYSDKMDAKYLPEEIRGNAADYWVLGFDTLHYGDTSTEWNEETVMQEANELKEQLEAVTA